MCANSQSHTQTLIDEESDQNQTRILALYASSENSWEPEPSLLDDKIGTKIPCANHMYDKTCVKRSLNKRQNKDLNDKW